MMDEPTRLIIHVLRNKNLTMYRIVSLLGLFFGAFFIFAGIFFAIQKPANILYEGAPAWYYFGIGGMIAAYGGFRIYRAWKALKQNKPS